MRRLALALALACAAAGASAQEAARFIQRDVSDQSVDQLLSAVTANLHQAMGENGQPLPPLSEAERATPLLDRDLVREVMDVGAASGVGAVCNLDWRERNFLPMMRRERARGDRNAHQLAAIAMLHGLVQSQIQIAGGACTERGVAAASDFYARKWGAAVAH